MTRCDEFYEKWKQDPNWCDKCESEVSRINKYIETLDMFPGLKTIAAGALRPVLEKKMDVQARNELLRKIEDEAKSGREIRSPDIVNLMKELPIGKKEDEEIPKVEKQIIHAVEWKEHMAPTVSRMDEGVYTNLLSLGVNAVAQEPICVLQVVPDILIRRGNKTFAVFLDGEAVHAGHEDRDQANRELLSRKGVTVISLPYVEYSAKEENRIVNEIIAAIE